MQQFELVFYNNLPPFEIHIEFNALFSGNNFYMHLEYILESV